MSASEDAPPGPVLVISAHAGDFVWRAAGAIALATARGAAVTVLCLSFGERGESAKAWREGKQLGEIKALRRDEASAAAEVLGARIEFADSFMIAALTGDGVDDLKRALAARMPAGDWHFPADQVSDATDRMLAAELTREQIYRQLHEELPYASGVRTEKYEERRDGSVAIHQQILVARDSQRAIVLGKAGARLKEIGSKARAELAALLGKPVHLFLHVKVDPKWDEDRDLYREIGLDWTE